MSLCKLHLWLIVIIFEVLPSNQGALLGCRHWVGDSSTSFTMQSGNKCFTYALAVDEYGSDKIHSHIGKEPSGASFNSLFLNAEGKSLLITSLLILLDTAMFVCRLAQVSPTTR